MREILLEDAKSDSNDRSVSSFENSGFLLYFYKFSSAYANDKLSYKEPQFYRTLNIAVLSPMSCSSTSMVALRRTWLTDD